MNIHMYKEGELSCVYIYKYPIGEPLEICSVSVQIEDQAFRKRDTAHYTNRDWMPGFDSEGNGRGSYKREGSRNKIKSGHFLSQEIGMASSSSQGMTTTPSAMHRLRSCSPGVLGLLHKASEEGITAETCLRQPAQLVIQRDVGRVRSAVRETSVPGSERLLQKWGHLIPIEATPVIAATTGTSSSAGNASTVQGMCRRSVEQGTGGMTRAMSEQSLSELIARFDGLLAEAKNKFEDNVIKGVRDEVRNMREQLREGYGLARKQSQASKQGLQRHCRKHRELDAQYEDEARRSEEEEERRMEEEREIYSGKKDEIRKERRDKDKKKPGGKEREEGGTRPGVFQRGRRER